INMKKILLSTLALAAVLTASAQTDTDHICEDGFIMEFNQEDRVSAIDTAGTADDTRMGIDWWGCGITGTPGAGDCSATDANYELSIADGKLSVATTKSVAGEGTWTPFGFSTLDGAGTKAVDLTSTKALEASYTNTSTVGMEVYWAFIFADGTISLDAEGAPIGGAIAAGETVTTSFDLNIPVIGNSWCISEAECLTKNNNNGGGNPVGGPACNVQCTWESSVDFSSFEGVELTIAGENLEPYADLAGEVIEFDYIRAGDYAACNGVSTEEIIVTGLNVYPNPATDALNVKYEATLATTVELTDLTGKVVATQTAQAGANTVNFATANVNAGVYFVNVKNVNGSTTQKVVIK
ncbi:MAG: T9SS type A sorting domain-containing protein, partial [Flavobacteriales bacterium]|nr:T9SS type A sorting domain-containing protein [Flavobacteriales bacterium]